MKQVLARRHDAPLAKRGQPGDLVRRQPRVGAVAVRCLGWHLTIVVRARGRVGVPWADLVIAHAVRGKTGRRGTSAGPHPARTTSRSGARSRTHGPWRAASEMSRSSRRARASGTVANAPRAFPASGTPRTPAAWGA